MVSIAPAASDDGHLNWLRVITAINSMKKKEPNFLFYFLDRTIITDIEDNVTRRPQDSQVDWIYDAE